MADLGKASINTEAKIVQDIPPQKIQEWGFILLY